MLKLGKYRHYKGGIYTLIHVAHHTEREDELLCIYKDIDGKIWARPFDMWIEQVEVNGEFVNRFLYIGE